MKKNVMLILITFLFLSILYFSCSKGEKTKVKIEKSVAEKIKLPEQLKVIEDLKKIRDAVVVYRNTNDVNPPSIEKLGLQLYYPDEYLYNAETGVVKSKHYPHY